LVNKQDGIVYCDLILLNKSNNNGNYY
jgi:hypothetical protein